jgi:uncharacterized protein YcbX
MATPRLAALVRYPVKSLGGIGCRRATVEPWGLAGDRRWLLAAPDGMQLTQREYPRLALVSVESLPDGGLRVAARGRQPLEIGVPSPRATVVVRVWHSKVEAVPAESEASAWFSEYLDTPVELLHMDAPERRRPLAPAYAQEGETVSFADGFPLLLTALSSLDALNSLVAQGDHPGEGPLPMERFRPNLVIAGTAPWAEDDWLRVRVGEIAFRVAKPCGRCVVTTTDQSTARRGREPLHTLARHRRFGNQLVFGQLLVPESTGRVRSGDLFEVIESR